MTQIECYAAHRVQVWNEMWGFPDTPNDRVPDVYMALYNASAVGLKAVHPSLRVGGPATAQTQNVAAFITACKAQNLPVDFVTTHFVSYFPCIRRHVPTRYWNLPYIRSAAAAAVLKHAPLPMRMPQLCQLDCRCLEC